jgi:hypothetical protein
MGKRKGAYRFLIENPKENNPLRIPRRRWRDNIRKDIKDIGWEGFDWN